MPCAPAATTSSSATRLARRLGASTGTTIQVVAPTGQSRGFRIVGQFHTGNNARDEGEAYVLLKSAQILSERPNAINDIRLRSTIRRRAAGGPPGGGRARLQGRALAGGERIAPRSLVVRNVIMYTVVGAILLVAGFGIFNIISTITHEKARDIAILKSLGFTQGDMRRLFLVEGVAMGLPAPLVGWLIGFLLCFALSQVEFKLSGAGDRPRDDPAAAGLEPLALRHRLGLRALSRPSPAISRPARRRGSTPSTSSGAPHERC